MASLDRLGRRTWRTFAAWAVVLVPLATAPASGQRAPVPSTRSEVAGRESPRLTIARRIMQGVRYCALISHDAAGYASTRTIDPLAPDSAFVVRFVTNPRSRKLREVARDSRVTLYYFDPAALAYVSLYGRARVVRDASERRRHWKAEWTPHYPDRVRDAVLVEVLPERLELVSLKDGITGDSATWAPPTERFPVRPRTP